MDGTEGRLARALRRGDEAALGGFAAYVQPVYAFVLPRVAGDPQAAEDVTQETFLAALDALERFDGRASLSTWLCAIARHKVADHFRRQQRLERLRLALQSPPALEVGLHERLEREELRRRVVVVLRTLAPHYRQALLLKYVDSLTGRQLATHLGISEEATESLLVRARAAFRQAFRDGDAIVRKEQCYEPA